MSTESPESYIPHDHDGTTFYFCSDHCLEKFKRIRIATWPVKPTVQAAQLRTIIPERIRSTPVPCIRRSARTTRATAPNAVWRSSRTRPTPGNARTEYTCPMHPEVIQEEAGECPKCGMALEPKTVEAESEENHEYLFMRNRFWVSAALSLSVMIIAMRDVFGLGSLEQIFGSDFLHWTEFALATPVVMWGGWVFYVRAWKSVVSWNLNMFTSSVWAPPWPIFTASWH